MGGFFAAAVKPPQSNPSVDPSRTIDAILAPPPEISSMLRRSCSDCHSNETRWPWYSRVEPVASQVVSDVERGRAAMNFSEWPGGRKSAGMLIAACMALETRRMPRSPYRQLHPESVPSHAEIESFCRWSKEEAKRILHPPPVTEQ